jgi:hypothetical protein
VEIRGRPEPDEVEIGGLTVKADGEFGGFDPAVLAGVHEEVLLGARTDLQYGPFLMVGLGGILVEVLKDVAIRLLPVDEGEDVEEEQFHRSRIPTSACSSEPVANRAYHIIAPTALQAFSIAGRRLLTE